MRKRSRVTGKASPISVEGVRRLHARLKATSAKAERELSVSFRPFSASLADTVEWARTSFRGWAIHKWRFSRARDTRTCRIVTVAKHRPQAGVVADPGAPRHVTVRPTLVAAAWSLTYLKEQRCATRPSLDSPSRKPAVTTIILLVQRERNLRLLDWFNGDVESGWKLPALDGHTRLITDAAITWHGDSS